MTDYDLLEAVHSNVGAVLQLMQPPFEHIDLLDEPPTGYSPAEADEGSAYRRVGLGPTSSSAPDVWQSVSHFSMCGSSRRFDARCFDEAGHGESISGPGVKEWVDHLQAEVMRLDIEAERDRREAQKWAIRARMQRKQMLDTLRRVGHAVPDPRELVVEDRRAETIFAEAAKYHERRFHEKVAAAKVCLAALRRTMCVRSFHLGQMEARAEMAA
ncbi:MAG TPA: hypothetical protein VGK19_20330 [Capsulimonadaceae bacterium]|jgi:hypothetical protein